MKTYTVITGDTLERISTIAYGTASEVDRIRSANPETSGGLAAGMVLTIPPGPADASVTLTAPAARENEVSVILAGELFRFWTSMAIERSIDSFDQFSLTAPFEPDELGFREAFAPLSFQRAELFVGGERLYTGVNPSNVPQVAVDGATVTAEGYALAGVVNDCPMPGSSFPIEYEDLDLRGIAGQQARPFGLTPVFDAEPGAPFERVAINEGGKVLPFWAKLAGQRGLVVGNDEFGQPVFRTESDAAPVQLLELGKSPVVSILPEFNPQQYYSHVTVVTPTFLGVIDGVQHTVVNPFLRGVTRPLTFQAEDLQAGEEVTAVNAKMGRMFANAIAYRVELAGWRNVKGELWSPNTSVRLLAPRAMVYEDTRFLIRSVTLRRDAAKDVASLLCVLPGAFSGRIPETLPWLV